MLNDVNVIKLIKQRKMQISTQADDRNYEKKILQLVKTTLWEKWTENFKTLTSKYYVK